MKKCIQGSCLCGSVRYAIEPPFAMLQYCHCSRCRKATGSAHAANLFVSPTQFRWTAGEEFAAKFKHPDAKYFSTCFCKHCGASLPWIVKGGKGVVVPAGSLDDDPGIRPTQNIFWGLRAPWCVDPSKLPQHATTPGKL